SLEEAYETLDLDRDATKTEAKKRYRELARQHHPDQINSSDESKRDEAEEKMIQINKAYKTIIDHLESK
ncbi:MAG: DnaJ family molecular chaperone, partial [bacterium]